MSFIRPEASAALRRYGEPVLYAAVAGFGLVQGISLILRGAWTGWLLTVIGALAALGLVGAAERAYLAWRNRDAGPGTVTIREGQIAYFGPLGGGILALDALTAIDIRIGARRDLIWVLSDELGQIVEIPGGADGAVALLDRLSTLAGFDHGNVMAASRAQRPTRLPIWRRQPVASLS